MMYYQITLTLVNFLRFSDEIGVTQLQLVVVMSVTVVLQGKKHLSFK